MGEKKHALASVPELEELLADISSIKMRNVGDDVLQRQEMTSSLFTLILETFDDDHMRGDVEMFDNRKHENYTLNKKLYQYFKQRPLHSHSYLEIMIVLSGTIMNQIEEESFVYRAGQGCIMNPYIRHREIPEGNASVLFIEIRQELLREMLGEMEKQDQNFKGSTLSSFLYEISEESDPGILRKQYLEFSPSNSNDVLQYARDMLCKGAFSSVRRNDPGCTYFIRAALLRFFTDLGDVSRYTLQQVSTSINHRDFLISKISLLLQSSHGKIKKSELEELLSYNGDYLNRIYKQSKGVTISDACKEIMVKDACRLLKQTDWSIDRIMQELNITSRGFFFSTFSQETGMTPREYRNA